MRSSGRSLPAMRDTLAWRAAEQLSGYGLGLVAAHQEQGQHHGPVQAQNPPPAA
jgi:hypothetical protein